MATVLHYAHCQSTLRRPRGLDVPTGEAVVKRGLARQGCGGPGAAKDFCVAPAVLQKPSVSQQPPSILNYQISSPYRQNGQGRRCTAGQVLHGHARKSSPAFRSS